MFRFKLNLIILTSLFSTFVYAQNMSVGDAIEKISSHADDYRETWQIYTKENKKNSQQIPVSFAMAAFAWRVVDQDGISTMLRSAIIDYLNNPDAFLPESLKLQYVKAESTTLGSYMVKSIQFSHDIFAQSNPEVSSNIYSVFVKDGSSQKWVLTYFCDGIAGNNPFSALLNEAELGNFGFLLNSSTNRTRNQLRLGVLIEKYRSLENLARSFADDLSEYLVHGPEEGSSFFTARMNLVYEIGAWAEKLAVHHNWNNLNPNYFTRMFKELQIAIKNKNLVEPLRVIGRKSVPVLVVGGGLLALNYLASDVSNDQTVMRLLAELHYACPKIDDEGCEQRYLKTLQPDRYRAIVSTAKFMFSQNK